MRCLNAFVQRRMQAEIVCMDNHFRIHGRAEREGVAERAGRFFAARR